MLTFSGTNLFFFGTMVKISVSFEANNSQFLYYKYFQYISLNIDFVTISSELRADQSSRQRKICVKYGFNYV